MTEVIVCGAGIAGVSAAFHLTRAGITDVVIADPRPPLTLTSDKSTECYRNWWPHAPMVQLMSRSIELLDTYAHESDNRFGLNRRGYLYVTGDPATLDTMTRQGTNASTSGAGELRIHRDSDESYQPAALDGFTDAPSGADLFLDGDLLRHHFPYISTDVVGGLHARTAGWLSAQQFGAWLLEQAESAGATLVRSQVTGVNVTDGNVRSVDLADGTTLTTRAFVNAAGPYLHEIGRLVGIDLPVHSEVHSKTGFRDQLGVFPREAPMIIWNDPQRIDWSPEEVDYLKAAGRYDLVEDMPAGCHGRPEGGFDSPWALGLWEFHTDVRVPEWPIPTDPLYTEVVLRGLSSMVPALGAYNDRLPEAVIDGGYYTKTIENRPLAGPAGPDGSFVCGALSGFGIMAACGVGELVAAAVTGGEMPPYAHWFDLRRYDDPRYRRGLTEMRDSGQL